MLTSSLIFSIAAFLMALLGTVVYLRKVKNNNTPKYPIGLLTSLTVALILSAIAVWRSFDETILINIFTYLFVIISVFLALNFMWFLSQSKTPIGDIKVSVGDAILPFELQTHDGQMFNSDALKGKPTLLKFYRGAWCPYCCAELKLFEAMKPTLAAYDVQIIAISNDSNAQNQMHIERDGISHLLLSDPDLATIRQYGIEHHKALAGDSDNTMKLMGMFLPTKVEIKPMAIPTSLLIDANGIIRWIDQSEDYRIRANEEKVMAAVKANFTPLG